MNERKEVPMIRPTTWDVYACHPGQPESLEGTVEAATFEEAWVLAQTRFGQDVNFVHAHKP